MMCVCSERRCHWRSFSCLARSGYVITNDLERTTMASAWVHVCIRVRIAPSCVVFGIAIDERWPESRTLRLTVDRCACDQRSFRVWKQKNHSHLVLMHAKWIWKSLSTKEYALLSLLCEHISPLLQVIMRSSNTAVPFIQFWGQLSGRYGRLTIFLKRSHPSRSFSGGHDSHTVNDHKRPRYKFVHQSGEGLLRSLLFMD